MSFKIASILPKDSVNNINNVNNEKIQGDQSDQREQGDQVEVRIYFEKLYCILSCICTLGAFFADDVTRAPVVQVS